MTANANHQNKIPTYQIMAHNNKWAPVYYQKEAHGITVTAVIPHSALNKKTHTIPREISTLLQMPSNMARMELAIKYGIHVSYEFKEYATAEEEMA